MSEVTITHSDDYVATVEIHRPPNNFIDVSLAEALADAFEQVDRSGARSIVLCSEGKHFCAGADLGGQSSASQVSVDDAAKLYATVERLVGGGTPVVAAVQGAAVGAGAGLALVADLRVATEATRFVFPFARLGFHQGFGITTTLPPLVGPSRALDLLYTGRPVMGEEAFRIGLCDRLARTDLLREEAHAFAAEIARSAPLAVRSIRKTLRGELGAALRESTRHEQLEQRAQRASNDHHEALRAAAAKETPRFTGT